MSDESASALTFSTDDVVFWMKATLDEKSQRDAVAACAQLLETAGATIVSVAKNPLPLRWADELPEFRIIAARSDRLRPGESAEAGMMRLYDEVMPLLKRPESTELNGPGALVGVAFPLDEGDEVTTAAFVTTRVQMGDQECPFDGYDEPYPEPEPDLTPGEAATQQRLFRQWEVDAAAKVVGVAAWTVGWGPYRSRDALLAWDADLSIVQGVNQRPPRDERGRLRLVWCAERPDGSAAEALAAVRARLPFTGWHEQWGPVSRTWWEADPMPSEGFVRVELVVGMTTLWSAPWWSGG